MFIIGLIITSMFMQLATPLQCYRCSASSRTTDKACVNGYSNVDRQECPDDHVCITYQYEISIHGLIKSGVTIRGCQPATDVEDCADLLDGVRAVVYPARARQIECRTCPTDLCN